MGNKNSSRADEIGARLEARVGKIPLSGRYHKLPKRLEDDYSIESKVLGSGYNGVVRLGKHKSSNSNQQFAIKAFKLDQVKESDRTQLEAEVEIVLCMDHPNIIRLYAVYECDNMLHLVMECMEGGELFDRVTERKRFTERDACHAVWEMLLAVNYLHSHDIVHRDLKLENFLYESKTSDHLKLIDFGFSKVWEKNTKMEMSCGTLSYVAPEVLKRSYTSQCDMWSLGVICFILLSGYMPFYGQEKVQQQHISEGKYVLKPEKWKNISQDGLDFTKSLIEVNPTKRLTAQQALDHPWIVNRVTKVPDVDIHIVDALRQFGQAAKFRRCCMEMMAWSLSNEERAKVRQYFTAMDQNKQGTITLAELKKVLQERFHVPDAETQAIFNAMDSNQDEEIHYSDFLAAMVNTRLVMHDDLLKQAFKKFDTDSSGYITVENLKEVLGESFDGTTVEQLVAEADQLKDGRISYAEFVSYIRGTPLEATAEAAESIVDKQLKGNAVPATGNSTMYPAPLRLRGSGSGADKADGGAKAQAGGAKAEDKNAQDQQKCCRIS